MRSESARMSSGAEARFRIDAPNAERRHRSAARALRGLAGMIYRFLEDGAGRVTAEDKDAKLPAFPNHHFPASDIPKRAREL
jgi:chemotaxis family two-component system sensor kinase Cph1